MSEKRPTEEAYAELQYAYDFYNKRLFGGQLKPCMITFQREKRTMGYFSRDRFIKSDGTRVRADEIALNPEYFAVFPMIVIMQTLVHEATHAWQSHFGTPSRTGYHNAEWANKMCSIGLIPSDTGQPGGRKVGQKMDDYPEPGGLFETVTKELFESGFAISWLDRHPVSAVQPASQASMQITALSVNGAVAGSLTNRDEEEPAEEEAQPSMGQYGAAPALDFEVREAGRSNRAKYSCSGCFTNVWGKPGLRIKCADCDELFIVAMSHEIIAEE